jgi:hypothetical protein
MLTSVPLMYKKSNKKKTIKYKSNHIEEFKTNNKFSPFKIVLSHDGRLFAQKGLGFQTKLKIFSL